MTATHLRNGLTRQSEQLNEVPFFVRLPKTPKVARKHKESP